MFYNISFCQQNHKELINKKINNIKKTVSDDSIRVKGTLKFYTGYRIFSENNAKPFEYRLSANLNVSYRGIKIPLSYNYSNGRSLYRINAPNLNLPKFNNLGFSPTYKWAKLHIGNRNMSFSKYTYDNLRFKGWGTELTPLNFQLKIFKGQIFQSSLNDLQFANTLSLPYKRNAWGVMTGYKSKKSEYSAIVFKADDDYISIEDTSIYKKIKPKANTSIGLVFKQNLFDKIDLSYDWAVTAVTRDLFAKRIDIPTHFTFYNMVGLYQKRESSVYSYARKFSISYTLNEDSYGFTYEMVGKDYKTFGSLLFDNNYEAFTMNLATKIKKVNLISEIGFRKDGISKESSQEGNRFVLNLNLNYPINDRIQLNSSYSNFKNVERNYYQSFNSLAFDSLSISLLNENFNLSSTFSFGAKKNKTLILLYSYQISNSIRSDSLILNSQLKNHIYSTSYSYNLKKFNLNSTLSFLSNKTDVFYTTAIIPTISLSYKLSNYFEARSNFSYNHMKTNSDTRRSLLINQDLNYQISKSQTIIFTNRWNFNTNSQKFKLLENLIELDYSLKF